MSMWAIPRRNSLWCRPCTLGSVAALMTPSPHREPSVNRRPTLLAAIALTADRGPVAVRLR